MSSLNAYKTTLRIAGRAPLARPRPFSTAPMTVDDLLVRVRAYGPERYRLAALATVTPSPAGGFNVKPYDVAVAADLRKSLMADAKANNLAVVLEKGTALRLVPKEEGSASNATWKTQKRGLAFAEARDNGEAFAEDAWATMDEAEAAFAPKSARLHMRLNKAWAPVDTRKATAKREARRALMAKKREASAALAVEALGEGLSVQMMGRLERLAASNGKAMRRMLKLASAKAGLDDYFPKPAPVA